MNVDRPTAMMTVMFILTALIALTITPLYVGEGYQAFEDTENVYIPLYYIGVILVFTALILVLIKKGYKRIFHGVVIFAFFVTISYVISPFVSVAMGGPEYEWYEEKGLEGVVDIEMVDLNDNGQDSMAVLYDNGTLEIRSRWNVLTTYRGVSQIQAVHDQRGDQLAMIKDGRLHYHVNGAHWPSGIKATSIQGYRDPVFVNDDGAFRYVPNPNSTDERVYTPWGWPNDYHILITNGSFDRGTMMADNAVLLSAEMLSYDLDGMVVVAASEDRPDILFGMGDRLLTVDNTTVRMLNAELGVERIWTHDLPVHAVLAADVWGNERQEIVVLEGNHVHLIYGKAWRVDYRISDELGSVEGVDAAFGEWDGDSDTTELLIVTEDGRVVWVDIRTEPYTDAEEVASLLSPQNIIVAALAAALTGLLLVYPEWYVLDTVGVVVSAGVASLFGISFGLLPSIILLSGLMVYDAFAVYQSKHMIDLADEAVSQHLPLLLVIPKDEGYSYLDQGSIKEQLDSGEEREAMFLGMGDLIIPTVLVVSAYRWLDPGVTVAGVGGNLVVALVVMFGILGGFAFLAVQVAKGKPHAGLPFLNSGALIGYFIAVLAVYGNLGF